MRKDQLIELQKETFRLAPYPNPNFPPSPYYRFLRLLAESKRPKLSVELGVCGGGGSLHLAMGYPSGIVIGIDNKVEYPDNIEYLSKTFRNFIFKLGDSVTLAKEIYESFGRIDILFIDTIHTYDRTIEEFEAWKPYLNGNAIVCLDDLNRIEMDGVWDYMPKEKIRLDDLHHSEKNEGGFGVVILNKD